MPPGHPYLRLFATTLGGFLLARGGMPAAQRRGRDWPGLARFYLLAVLPPALALEQQIIAGARSLNPGLLSAA